MTVGRGKRHSRKEGYGKKTDGSKIGGIWDRIEKEEMRIQRQ